MAGALAAVFVLALSLVAHPAAGEGWTDRFIDPEDGALDLSEHLLKHRGFLPVPIVITEPAVGYGGGAALLFFRESVEEASRHSLERTGRRAPPDISGLAGFATENGTWGGGAFHFGSFAGDRYRYLGALGKAALNLDYYTPGGRALAYRLDGTATVQQILARAADSDWFLGARYAYFGTTSRFSLEVPAGVLQRELEARIGKLGAVIDYDSRDNIFTPNRGTFAEIELAASRPAFGANFSFETLSARAFHFLPLGDRAVLGLRGDGQFASGGVPFFAQPFVQLRGVPAARYQDQRALVAEAELRWNLTPRWALVGFGGVGKAYGKRQSFGEATTVGAGGAGFRYLIARRLGIYAGIDLARGPEDTAFYIQVGSAWR